MNEGLSKEQFQEALKATEEDLQQHMETAVKSNVDTHATARVQAEASDDIDLLIIKYNERLDLLKRDAARIVQQIKDTETVCKSLRDAWKDCNQTE